MKTRLQPHRCFDILCNSGSSVNLQVPSNVVTGYAEFLCNCWLAFNYDNGDICQYVVCWGTLLNYEEGLRLDMQWLGLI